MFQTIIIFLLIGGIMLIFKFLGLIFKAVGFLLGIALKIVFSIFWIIVVLVLATCIL